MAKDFLRKQREIVMEKQGKYEETIQNGNVDVDPLTLLKVCANKKDLHTGSKIHIEILKRGMLEKIPYLGSSLINMYSKCGELEKASKVLEELKYPCVASWNALISGYTQLGHFEKAIKCFKKMKNEGLSPHAITFTCILKACGSLRNLNEGEKIHYEVVKRGFLWNDAVLGNALIDMYAKCGALEKAQEVIEGLQDVRDIVSWNALISGYAKQGKNNEVIMSFNRIQSDGLSPDAITFTCVLKACDCGTDGKGFFVHGEIVCKGYLGKDIVLDNAVVDMYARCGMFVEAKQVLDGIRVRELASWNAIILGYARWHRYEDAVNSFEYMQNEGISPDVLTFACILKVCGSRGEIDKGREIHDEVVRKGLLLLRTNNLIGNALIDMYARFSAISDAHKVLNELPIRDVVSWSILIQAYAQKGQHQEAFNCFEQMQHEGLEPNKIVLAYIMKVCGNIGAIDKGRKIHEEIARKGILEKDVMLSTAVVDMYVKCGALARAHKSLVEMSFRDVVSWTSLISGYARHGLSENALHCFEKMQKEGITPNAITFNCILKACGNMGAIYKGKQIHDEIVRKGLLLGKEEEAIMLGTSLVDMYARCGALTKARQVLYKLPSRKVASWNALITGYTREGHTEEAMECFNTMRQEGLTPDSITFICILRMCGDTGAVWMGRKIHDEIIHRGLLGKVDIGLGNALVDMYARCGSLVKAKEVLSDLPIRDVVSWSTLISGYANYDQGKEALECFEQMLGEGLSPNAIICVSLLKACGSTGSIGKGKQIYDEVASKGLVGKDCVLGNALVDMYAKCGELEKAKEILRTLLIRDVISWTSLISGYALQGQGERAIDCFQEMQREGISPNEVTFRSVLTACSHSGLLDEGQMYYANMNASYGINPDIEHHACLVDLFGRAGLFEEALVVIKEMNCSDYAPVWGALLGACLKGGNISLGKVAFERAVEIDYNNDAAYQSMTNIYLTAGMLEEAEMIEAMRVGRKYEYA